MCPVAFTTTKKGTVAVVHAARVPRLVSLARIE